MKATKNYTIVTSTVPIISRVYIKAIDRMKYFLMISRQTKSSKKHLPFFMKALAVHWYVM